MIALLDTGDLAQAESELGCEVGQLLCPKGHSLQDGRLFGIDNGCYARFDESRFFGLLRNNLPFRDRCKFVAVPDVVGNARLTLAIFDRYRHTPELRGWPLALVAQDGLEDLDVPWDNTSAIFIGGSTEWKLGRGAAAIVKAAKILRKHVHAGRVNTPERFEYFEELGADSIDGTGLSKYTHMRSKVWFARTHPSLFSNRENGDVVCGPETGLVGAAPILDQVGAYPQGQGTEAD